MSTKDLKEKGTHFLLLTGSTLLMAVGTYFGSITNFVGFPIPLVALSAHIE